MVPQGFEAGSQFRAGTCSALFELVKEPQHPVNGHIPLHGLAAQIPVSGQQNPVSCRGKCKRKDIRNRKRGPSAAQTSRLPDFSGVERNHTQSFFNEIRADPVEKFGLIQDVWHNKLEGQIKKPRRERGSFYVDQN